MSKKYYKSKFGDLDPASCRYSIEVYLRVLKGSTIIDGRPVEVKMFPNGFWDETSAKELVRYFALEMNNWTREDICTKLTVKVLQENHLEGVCKVFGSSTYRIISKSFPEFKINPWELVTCPNAFWQDPKNCAKVLKWVAKKEKIANNPKKFCDTISYDLLRKYHVANASKNVGGLYELVELTYPGKYKPWDLKKIGKKISDDLVIQAVRWMIEEKLKWSHEEVCENLRVRTFYDCGIGSILSKGCNHSPIVALEKAYPGEYTREMLKNSENPFKR